MTSSFSSKSNSSSTVSAPYSLLQCMDSTYIWCALFTWNPLATRNRAKVASCPKKPSSNSPDWWRDSLSSSTACFCLSSSPSNVQCNVFKGFAAAMTSASQRWREGDLFAREASRQHPQHPWLFAGDFGPLPGGERRWRVFSPMTFLGRRPLGITEL